MTRWSAFPARTDQKIKNNLLYLNELTQYFRKNLDYPQPFRPDRGYDSQSEG